MSVIYNVGDIFFGYGSPGAGFQITKGDVVLAEYLKSKDGFVLRPTKEYDTVDNHEALTKVVARSQRILNSFLHERTKKPID